MPDKKLEDRTKDELIQIILNLQQKYKIEDDELPPLKIDYRALLEATSDIIFLLDKDGNVVYMNNAWRSFYPSMKDRIVKGHYTDNIPDIERERSAVVFNDVIQRGKVSENELMKTYNEEGNPIYFIASFSPLRDDNNEIQGLLGIMKNNTERHLIRKKLKANTRALEGKIRELVEKQEELKGLRELSEDIIYNAPLGIFMMDPLGIMLSENPALKNIMAHGEETRVGVNLLEYEGFVRAGFAKLFNRCLVEKKTVKMDNAPYVPIAGDRELIVDIFMDPLLDEKGNVKRIIVMVEDKTEQAKIEKRAKRAESISSIGRLSQGIALELRSPIDQMYMDWSFVNNNLDKNSPAFDYHESMKQQLHRIRNVSEQLLALSGPEKGEKEICEINRVLQTHPLDILLNRLRDRGYTLELKLPDESPTVKATQNQLKQVLFDMIENAEEAMPDLGTIAITVEVSETVDGNFVVITIADSGVGIPENKMQEIFQPFVTTKGDNATGLGLMIASNVIENLGGTIAVKSTPGQGTVFKIALPML